MKLLLVVVGLFVAMNVFAQADTTSVLHPEKAIAALAWLKGNSLVWMVLVGFVWKYAPFMKGISNNLIPWVNVLVFVLTTLGGVAVAAGPGDIAPHVGFATRLLLGFLHSGVATVLYNGFLRPVLDETVGRWTGTVQPR
jgi:hypothetical protein